MNHMLSGVVTRNGIRLVVIGALALLLTRVPPEAGAGPNPDSPIAIEQHRPVERPGTALPLSPQAADTVVIASFDFEDGLGGPDPQGWTEVDVTAQTGTFFHVDDFAGLGGVIAPISGNRSLWCGSRGDSCWGFTPGYGNNWGQDFKTLEFPSVTGDVKLTYNLKYGMEPGYDFLHVQYRGTAGTWVTLTSYTGYSGVQHDSVTVPAELLSGEIDFRFRFVSDALYSDEDGAENSDGAVVLDDIVVTDATGVVDTQDFEAEAPGALKTVDNRWKAYPRSGAGKWMGLFDGSTVVQENGPVNDSHVYVFFRSSPDYYACGGFPLQRAVLYGPSDEGFYLRNEIRSEWIDITHDENMLPVASFDNAYLEFDVYRDLLQSVGVFYQWKVRTRTNGGCPGNWRNAAWYYFGTDKSWYRHVGDMTGYIEPGTTGIQIALGVFDCGDPINNECPPGVVGGCHSHAPLLDNVRVIVTTSAQSGVADAIPGGDALLAPHPNPARGPVTVGFSLGERGGVEVDIYDVAGRRVRALTRGTMDAGLNEVVWDGRDDRAGAVAGGIYFVRLRAGNGTFVRRVIRLDGR